MNSLGDKVLGATCSFHRHGCPSIWNSRHAESFARMSVLDPLTTPYLGHFLITAPYAVSIPYLAGCESTNSPHTIQPLCEAHMRFTIWPFRYFRTGLTPSSLMLMVITVTTMLSFNGLIGASFSAQVNESEDLWSTLAKTRSLKCTFETVMQGDWKGGRLSLTKERESFILHFDSIEPDTRRARLIGNVAAEDVLTSLTQSGITFVEITGSGNVNFTTVFPRYKRGTEEFIAVTSRHLLLLDNPVPSQHHGTCIVLG